MGDNNLIAASALCCLGVLKYRMKNTDFVAEIRCFEESIQLQRLLLGNQEQSIESVTKENSPLLGPRVDRSLELVQRAPELENVWEY